MKATNITTERSLSTAQVTLPVSCHSVNNASCVQVAVAGRRHATTERWLQQLNCLAADITADPTLPTYTDTRLVITRGQCTEQDD